MAPTSTATAPPPRERRAASATLQHLYLAKMSSARNRAQSLTVKTAVGSCTSPKFDLPSSDSFQARLLFWRGTDPKMVFLTGIVLGLPFGFLSGLSTGLVNRHYGVSFRDRSRV